MEVSSAAPIEPMPALLTRTSIRPNRSITCWTAAVTESSLATSRSRNVTPSSGVTREVSRLVPTTSKPASTSASAASFPMPEDAPVTSATGRFVVIMHSRTRLRNRSVSTCPHCKPIGFRCTSSSGEPIPGRATGRLQVELTGTRRHDGTRPMSRQERRDSTIRAPRSRVFALKGYYGTPAEAIAKRAGATQPYLFRLIPDTKAIAALTRSTEDARLAFESMGKGRGTSGPPAPWAAQWRSVTRGRSRRTPVRRGPGPGRASGSAGIETGPLNRGRGLAESS